MEWRGFGTSTPHVIHVHQPSLGNLLFKGNSAGVLTALDIQAAKLGSLHFATGHPKLSPEALHELVADLKGYNREKDVVDMNPPGEPMAVSFSLKCITDVDEKLSTEFIRVQ